jgi:hypothetical protein
MSSTATCRKCVGKGHGSWLFARVGRTFCVTLLWGLLHHLQQLEETAQ